MKWGLDANDAIQTALWIEQNIRNTGGMKLRPSYRPDDGRFNIAWEFSVKGSILHIGFENLTEEKLRQVMDAIVCDGGYPTIWWGDGNHYSTIDIDEFFRVHKPYRHGGCAGGYLRTEAEMGV